MDIYILHETDNGPTGIKQYPIQLYYRVPCVLWDILIAILSAINIFGYKSFNNILTIIIFIITIAFYISGSLFDMYTTKIKCEIKNYENLHILQRLCYLLYNTSTRTIGTLNPEFNCYINNNRHIFIQTGDGRQLIYDNSRCTYLIEVCLNIIYIIGLSRKNLIHLPPESFKLYIKTPLKYDTNII